MARHPSAGRRLATGEARLLQDDRELVRVVASFVDLGQASGEPQSLYALDKAKLKSFPNSDVRGNDPWTKWVL